MGEPVEPGTSEPVPATEAEPVVERGAVEAPIVATCKPMPSVSDWLVQLTDDDLAADWLANAEPDLTDFYGLGDDVLWAAGYVSQYSRQLAAQRYSERAERWQTYQAAAEVARE